MGDKLLTREQILEADDRPALPNLHDEPAMRRWLIEVSEYTGISRYLEAAAVIAKEPGGPDAADLHIAESCSRAIGRPAKKDGRDLFLMAIMIERDGLKRATAAKEVVKANGGSPNDPYFEADWCRLDRKFKTVGPAYIERVWQMFPTLALWQRLENSSAARMYRKLAEHINKKPN